MQHSADLLKYAPGMAVGLPASLSTCQTIFYIIVYCTP